jgi:hypothetical protein
MAPNTPKTLWGVPEHTFTTYYIIYYMVYHAPYPSRLAGQSLHKIFSGGKIWGPNFTLDNVFTDD